ncbi:MAG TPA: DUF5998 family protein, partial [Actinomycetales bacterium]|nr:DUF5998 family protein [Actinomycetales bacterium]
VPAGAKMVTMSELSALHERLEHAGYYPALVRDVVDVAVAGEDVVDQLVHLETTFDHVEVRRHVTALALTPTRLIIVHVDDHPPEVADGPPAAVASSEAVPLGAITGVLLTHGVRNPAAYESGDDPDEVTVAIAWNAVRRIDIGPAQCADPNCDVEHGLTGNTSPEDIMLRFAAEAEGIEAVRAAIVFAQNVSGATRSLLPAANSLLEPKKIR